MSIRLRVAVVFTLALASAFALLSWLLVSRLSAAELGTVDAQLAAQLSQAGRYVHHGSGSPASASAPAPGEYDIQVIDASGRVQGASPDTGRSPCCRPPTCGRPAARRSA